MGEMYYMAGCNSHWLPYQSVMQYKYWITILPDKYMYICVF